MRVLVIDDDEQLRAAAARVMRGHEVTTAGTGEEGLALVGSGAFDVVLCDMEMPGISGLEVWSRLPEGMKSRFVMWTGRPDLVVGVEFPVLAKPVPTPELREELTRRGAP
jgi:CheY-like chemotaxis protein